MGSLLDPCQERLSETFPSLDTPMSEMSLPAPLQTDPSRGYQNVSKLLFLLCSRESQLSTRVEGFEDTLHSSPAHYGQIQQLGKLSLTQTLLVKAPTQLQSLSSTHSFICSTSRRGWGGGCGGSVGALGISCPAYWEELGSPQLQGVHRALT